MSLQNFLTSWDICSRAMSVIMEVGAPISFANCLIACSTLDFLLIGTTYTKPLSITKSWQHMCPWDDHPPFFVAKNVSMKKQLCIRRYLSMQLFMPYLCDRVGSCVQTDVCVVVSMVLLASSGEMSHILDRCSGVTPHGLDVLVTCEKNSSTLS